MRSSLRTVALAISAWLALAPAARAEVQLSIRNGRVTIVAKDATVRQILAEWARVGKTKIVNGERVPGGTVTLELKDVPEADALDVLLRTLSGYMAAPRTTSVGADASVYDAIVVMPTIAAAAGRVGTPSNAPPAFSPPVFNQTNEDEQQVGEGGPGVVRQGGANPVRPPIFTTFPSPQQGNPNGNGNAPRLVLPRPGAVAPQNNGNPAAPAERSTFEPVVNGGPAQATPTPTPASGGLVGTSAPGMLPPAAASQPGQVAPQRPNNQ